MEIDSPESPSGKPGTSEYPCSDGELSPASDGESSRPNKRETPDNVGASTSGIRPQTPVQRPGTYGKSSRHTYAPAELSERCKPCRSAYDTFIKLATLGDVSSIYRNRPVWTGYSASELIQVGLCAFNGIPSARNAVLTYIGNLVHENAHHFFTKIENQQLAIDYSNVESAVLSLIATVTAHVEEGAKGFRMEVLQWCCVLASELSQQNSGRICIQHSIKSRGTEGLMEIFLQCPGIQSFVKLMDRTLTILLDICPDECMTVLVEASKHGTIFTWIWLHIATSFPDAVVDHLFSVGAEQFKAYVAQVRAQERIQAQPSAIAAMHEEYVSRFRTLSEVFNYLTFRGNIELKHAVVRMITKSLASDTRTPDGSFENLDFTFFFKLVTCSVVTLKHLIAQHIELVTPMNIFLGVRQISSVEKTLILSDTSYPDFVRLMVQQLEPLQDKKALAVIFRNIVHIVFDNNIFIGYEHQEPGVSMSIKQSAALVMEQIIDRLLRIAHTTVHANPVDFPAFNTFSHGEDLGMIINGIQDFANLSGVVVRYLHTISVVFGETKAAEISLRLLYACTKPEFMSIFVAYLSVTVPLFPTMLSTMYERFSGLRAVIRQEKNFKGDELTLIVNLRILFEWDALPEPTNTPGTIPDLPALGCFRVFPGLALGEVLTTTLGYTLDAVATYNENGNKEKSIVLVNEMNLLLKSCLYPSATRRPQRKLVLECRHWYKLALQLASLLRLSLGTVCEAQPNAVLTFEETRAAVWSFMMEQLETTVAVKTVEKFIESFIVGCLLDNQALFGDRTCLNPYKSLKTLEDQLQEKEEDCCLLDEMQSLSLKKKLVALAQTGIIGSGRRKMPNGPTFDEAHREFVFIDCVRTMCTRCTPEANLLHTKVLALVMTDALSQSTVTVDFEFFDWDLEKETISACLEMAKKVETSSVAESLLDIVSLVQPCGWLNLPVIKAMLASILMTFDSVPDKLRRPSDVLLERVERWMLLVRKGDTLPPVFETLVDVLPLISHHEGSLLLQELWKYFQSRRVLQHHAIEAVTMTRSDRRTLHGPTEPFLSMFRHVLNANIDVLAPYYSQFFGKEIEDCNNEIEDLSN